MGLEHYCVIPVRDYDHLVTEHTKHPERILRGDEKKKMSKKVEEDLPLAFVLLVGLVLLDPTENNIILEGKTPSGRV